MDKQMITLKSRRFGQGTEWQGVIDKVVKNADVGADIIIIGVGRQVKLVKIDEHTLGVGLVELAKDMPIRKNIDIDDFRTFIQDIMTPSRYEDDCTTTGSSCNSDYLTIDMTALKEEDYMERELPYDPYDEAMKIDFRLSQDAAIRVKEQRMKLIMQPCRVYNRKLMSHFSKVLLPFVGNA